MNVLFALYPFIKLISMFLKGSGRWAYILMEGLTHDGPVQGCCMHSRRQFRDVLEPTPCCSA